MPASDSPAILQRDNLLSLARLLGAVVLAGLATQALRGGQGLLDGILFLGGAVTLFLWEFLRRPLREAEGAPLSGESPLSRNQRTALALMVIPAALAWLSFADNRLHPLGLLALAVAVAITLLATWQRGRPAAPPHPVDGKKPASPGAGARGEREIHLLPARARYLALLGIVILAAAFRLYLLDTLPGDMFNDLAHNYQETQRILDGQWMIYATGFPGREPLLFYLTALLSLLSGLSFYTLKLITALVGIATIPVVYLLGREAWNDAVGLVAALLLAVAKWHVLISRVGFRGILTPLLAALVAYFLLRGLRRGRRGDFLWAGALAGLSLYTYTASLAILPAVAVGLGLYALAGRAGDLWRMRRSLLLAALLALLVALPMLRFMLIDGADLFWSRPLTRVSERETALPDAPGKIWLGNLGRTAGMFHLRGDSIFRTNIPYDPHLDVVAGALFLLGLPLAAARWRRGGSALALAFFLLLLLPTTLSLAFPQEVPGAVRAGGAMATVMLFPALAAVSLWRRLGELLPALRAPWAWGGLLAGLALLSGPYNAHLCFGEYPRVLPRENYPLFRQMAQAIDQFSADGPVFLKTIPHWDDKDAIRVQTRAHKEWGLHGEIVDRIDPALFQGYPQAAVIVNPTDDAASLQALQQLYPHGVTISYRDEQGRPHFAVFLFRTEGGP